MLFVLQKLTKQTSCTNTQGNRLLRLCGCSSIWRMDISASSMKSNAKCQHSKCVKKFVRWVEWSSLVQTAPNAAGLQMKRVKSRQKDILFNKYITEQLYISDQQKGRCVICVIPSLTHLHCVNGNGDARWQYHWLHVEWHSAVLLWRVSQVEEFVVQSLLQLQNLQSDDGRVV